jgi:hypothetical protein
LFEYERIKNKGARKKRQNVASVGATLPNFTMMDELVKENQGTCSSFYSNEEDDDNTCFYGVDKILCTDERMGAAENLL